MKIAVAYRIDAHSYDARTGNCRPRCSACAREAPLYNTAADAIRDQPPAELALEDGDQAGLFPPARRFQIVIVDMFA
jgi:hypothetical protein